jgi:hypothetical protein
MIWHSRSSQPREKERERESAAVGDGAAVSEGAELMLLTSQDMQSILYVLVQQDFWGP